MTTLVSTDIPIQVVPGVCPSTDCTGSDTEQFTAADKIRFVKGRPQKLGGWVKTAFNNGATISGVARGLFSAQLNSKLQTVIGTNEKYYSLVGTDLTNVTPLKTTSTAIANSLDTLNNALPSSPITTTAGSTTITFADLQSDRFVPGDAYTISGASAVGGIPASDINKTHIVRDVNTATNKIFIKVATAATSSVGAGGGAMTRSTSIVKVNATAHGQSNGDRIKISGATAFGGIASNEINAEFVVRNVDTNSFDIVTTGTSTSNVTGGGGASTVFFEEISGGSEDEQGGQGYGMGRYGFRRYGTALTSDNGRRYPRIWFFDTYGNNILATAGNASGVYTWDGESTVAPVLVANAPTDVNYAFVSNNILVTLGADGIRNRIKGSDQNDITNWASSSTNQVFTDDIEGAGLLRSHVSLNGTNLLFTNAQCYTFRYIGLPFVWEIKFKDNIGIVAPMARVVVKGVAYWMGENNFYEWRGGNVEVMGSNTGSESTLLKYVFENINRSQMSKCFAWYNKKYDEIWFHYPSEDSNEVDRIVRYHVKEKHWTPDTMDRACAEYPNNYFQYPRLISSGGYLFRHEVGYNDDVNSMPWSLSTNLRDFGTNNVQQPEVIPDSIQTSDISVLVESFSFPQSKTAKNTKTITVEPTTPRVPLGVDGRYIKYTFSGDALDQNWIMGKWKETVQESSRSE